MTDFYLKHPEVLGKQPKRNIAEYVESKVLLVPRRFSSLSESKKSSLKILARRRKIQISRSSWNTVLEEIAREHLRRSKLFKPEVSIAVGENLFDKKEYRRLVELAWKTKQNQSIPIYVVSDGTTAFVRRI